MLVVLAVPILIGIAWYRAASGDEPENGDSTIPAEGSTTLAPEPSTTPPASTTAPGETTTSSTETTIGGQNDTGAIYTMGADGSNPVWLTNGAAPAWSPTGDQIVFEGAG